VVCFATSFLILLGTINSKSAESTDVVYQTLLTAASYIALGPLVKAAGDQIIPALYDDTNYHLPLIAAYDILVCVVITDYYQHYFVWLGGALALIVPVYVFFGFRVVFISQNLHRANEKLKLWSHKILVIVCELILIQAFVVVILPIGFAWICVRCLTCCYKKKMKINDQDRDSATEPDYARYSINVDDHQEQILSPLGDLPSQYRPQSNLRVTSVHNVMDISISQTIL
jgi:hypothetical protein